VERLRMKLRNGKAKLVIELSPEIKKALHLECVALDISMSSLVASLAEEWLKKVNKETREKEKK
jgi:hypothetical protein